MVRETLERADKNAEARVPVVEPRFPESQAPPAVLKRFRVTGIGSEEIGP
jgi:hypothetical protein